MKIDNQLVTHLAQLCHVDFSESEQSKIKVELQQMITFLTKIESLEIDKNIEPIRHIVNNQIDLRDDIVAQSLNSSVAFKEAPQEKNNFYVVPKFVKP
ncbi:MAG: Asp-tRNA(Asn)/Glu-tRNA(Gln) amidotransferase subunit GatC [Phycisphaerales bacterium]|nr:Asp-tRNA(Asn)/Glu-tRNA(Gln) amidotransferase subunit GatC [Phycisphaerales bacterium]